MNPSARFELSVARLVLALLLADKVIVTFSIAQLIMRHNGQAALCLTTAATGIQRDTVMQTDEAVGVWAFFAVRKRLEGE